MGPEPINEWPYKELQRLRDVLAGVKDSPFTALEMVHRIEDKMVNVAATVQLVDAALCRAEGTDVGSWRPDLARRRDNDGNIRPDMGLRERLACLACDVDELRQWMNNVHGRLMRLL